MKRIYFLLGTLCCFSFFVQAESPDNPDLAKAEEISSALFDHKSGKIVGAGNPAKQRLSNEEIHALSEFIPGLK